MAQQRGIASVMQSLGRCLLYTCNDAALEPITNHHDIVIGLTPSIGIVVTICALLLAVFVYNVSNPKNSDARRRGRDDEGLERIHNPIEAIASRQWKVVLAWISFHPDELLLVDKDKKTALHQACLFRAPAQVIEMLLFQAPELASMCNVDGETALHWAVRLSAPTEVLNLLLSASPSSGVLMKDKNGNTPLSLIWERHQDDLLQAWWRDRKNLTNLPCWRRIMLMLHYYQHEALSQPSSSSSTGYLQDDMEDIDPSSSSGSELPLHVASRCPCPGTLYQLILHSNMDEIAVQDERGRIPLAIACQDPVSNRSIGIHTKIHELVAEYPAGALCRDTVTGRIPLLIALASGVVWDEGIDKLFAIDPSTLQLRDPITGLRPFCLAAVGATNDNNEADHVEDKDELENTYLSTIYNLLRADPSQLTNPIE